MRHDEMIQILNFLKLKNKIINNIKLKVKGGRRRREKKKKKK